ncbi:MAG: atsA 8, partial [Armatimonadetes bacterium]|nr:atsA 8 [Armatimonadota bacterium]
MAIPRPLLLPALAAALLAGTVSAGRAADPVRRPNVLLILADDMGFSDVGCYGGDIDTPNLDRLARGGVRFTQFYNTARCWPTRAGILTGYYAQQVNMDPQRGAFPKWARVLPHYLKPLGYRSYHSGKWHFSRAERPITDGGFDRSYKLDDHDRNFYPKKHTEDEIPLPAVPPGTSHYSTTAIADHAIRCLKEHAREYRDQPFFEYLAFTVPHFPLQAPAEDIARYRDRYLKGWDVMREARWKRQQKQKIVDTPLSAPESTLLPRGYKQELLGEIGEGELQYALPWKDLSPAQQRFQATKMAIHAAMVDRMDREIGRVLDQVRAMGAEENTLVLFLSDNGASSEMLNRGDKHAPNAAPGSGGSYLCLGPGWATVSNTPFRRHKIWVHEGGISTPLIARWPKGISARGELRRTPGHVIDFAPTLLDVAGAKPTDTWNGVPVPPLPGRSLVPAFKRDEPAEREIYFHH